MRFLLRGAVASLAMARGTRCVPPACIRSFHAREGQAWPERHDIEQQPAVTCFATPNFAFGEASLPVGRSYSIVAESFRLRYVARDCGNAAVGIFNGATPGREKQKFASDPNGSAPRR
jgi:hypothetical protein